MADYAHFTAEEVARHYAECAALAGNPGECCARWCDTCQCWIQDGAAIIVTPPGSVASDDNQITTCPKCGGKVERIKI
jgi:hypothetical protein